MGLGKINDNMIGVLLWIEAIHKFGGGSKEKLSMYEIMSNLILGMSPLHMDS